jgi:hypothetical protein
MPEHVCLFPEVDLQAEDAMQIYDLSVRWPLQDFDVGRTMEASLQKK